MEPATPVQILEKAFSFQFALMLSLSLSLSLSCVCMLLNPPPLYEQEVTQGQFLSGV